MSAVLRAVTTHVIRWHMVQSHGLGLHRTSSVLRNISKNPTPIQWMPSASSLQTAYPGYTSLTKKYFCSNANSTNDAVETKHEANDTTKQMERARQDIATMRTMGLHVPEKISDADLEQFLTLTSKKGRKKFLFFLFKKELMRSREKQKKAELARLRAASKEKGEENEDNGYQNRYQLHLQNNTVVQFDNWHLAAGMMFGSKIVYDFSYDDHMKRQEMISLVQQLLYALNANKHARDPFDIHWVGLGEGSKSLKEAKRMLSGHFDNLMVNTTAKDLLEVFPKEKLVYLSADSPNVLQSYNFNKVYVVGAMVDSHVICSGVSLARAKRHDIEHARLPLDMHLQWTSGGKNLTLDQMMKIMIEMNTSGDWVKALQHVPIRKHGGLRLGPHWDPESSSTNAMRKRMQQDGIQRNPSQFVSSRARQSKQWHLVDDNKQATRSRRPSTHTQKLMENEDVDEDVTDDTLFGGAKSKVKD